MKDSESEVERDRHILKEKGIRKEREGEKERDRKMFRETVRRGRNRRI